MKKRATKSTSQVLIRYGEQDCALYKMLFIIKQPSNLLFFCFYYHFFIIDTIQQ